MADRDVADRTLGQFVLREQIGEGGHGIIYRGEQPALEREVVIKVLRPERGGRTSRERFLREARLAAQLRHPCATHIAVPWAQMTMAWGPGSTPESRVEDRPDETHTAAVGKDRA